MPRLRTIALCFLLVAAFAAGAFAHSGATGIVKQRMDAMSSIKASMKALGAMVKGEQAFSAGAVAKEAGSIQAHAKGMAALFPEGSLDHPSEALPSIWQSFDKFKAIADELETTAAELAKVSDRPGLLAGMKAVGATCKSCHQDYRKP